MSTVTSLQHNTLFFDFEQGVRQQLETQESESRADLQSREADERKLKEKGFLNEKLIEELRPLCEELPPDALDPVTMEPFERPLIYRCGHAIDTSTAVKIAKMKKLNRESSLECNLCKVTTPLKGLYSCFTLEGCIERIKKIKNLFNMIGENERMG